MCAFGFGFDFVFHREEELAGRIEVLEKLRGSLRELEKEKRDSEKRYREQVSLLSFSWYLEREISELA